MGRHRTFDRDDALERALRLFWRYGYDATSVAELTTAMRIGPPSMYATFGGKRQLFEEAVARYQETHGAFTARALAEEPTGRGAIERVLHEAAREYCDPAHPPGCLIISAAINCGPGSADVEAWLRTFREETKGAFAARFEGDVAAGRLGPNTDTASLATFYASVIQGMSTQARDGVSGEELDRVADVAMQVWPART